MSGIEKLMKYRREKPGLTIDGTQAWAVYKKRGKNVEANVSEDCKNRQYVQAKITEYIKQGFSKEKIIDNILKDDVMKNFEYLKNNGLSIEHCVTDWVECAFKRYNEGKNLQIER